MTASDPQQRPVPAPPRGWWKHIIWLGPAFVWMVSAAGSGEVLFTPRIGAMYGYALLWALIAAVTLKWFINHEMGRFAVCTGGAIMYGLSRLPGPKNWAVWFMLLPQLMVAVSLTAGMASAAASATVLLLPGSVTLWMIILTVAASALVLFGHYGAVEKTATVLALALGVAGVTAALWVGPDYPALAAGAVPSIPHDVNYSEILPWLGFMMAGAAGIMWYSYWITARGYGAAGATEEDSHDTIDPCQIPDEQRQSLRGWIKQMTLDNTVAVVGTLLPTIGFLILGAELLRPEGLLPEGQDVAETIGKLLGGVWGPFGFWFMVGGMFIAFWGSLLSQQDGFGRLFADGTKIVLKQFGAKGRWTKRSWLQAFYVIVLVTILPIVLFMFIGEPVVLLQIAGTIEAVQLAVLPPVLLYMNRTQLPKDLRPGWTLWIGTVLAGLFFLAFAVVLVLQRIGILGGGSGG